MGPDKFDLRILLHQNKSRGATRSQCRTSNVSENKLIKLRLMLIFSGVI